jgi:hypothetical protein
MRTDVPWIWVTVGSTRQAAGDGEAEYGGGGSHSPMPSLSSV